MDRHVRVLLVDDNPSDRLLTVRELQKEFSGPQIGEVLDRRSFEQALSRGDFDIVITDYELHWSDGIAVLKQVKTHHPEVPVILFTASGTQEIAVLAMKQGAADYVVKSETNIPRVRFAARNALDRAQQLRVMRENERLAMIGRLTASVAHEINQPLEVVRNALFLLESVPETPEKSKILQLAKEEVTRIEQITSRTLGFYRESQVPVSVDLGEILEEVLAMFSKRFTYQNIRLDRDYGEGTASVFPGEMRQVFSNLIDNAMDAMTSGGVLRVRTRSFSGERQEPWVEVELCDTGTGIAAEHLPKIFDPLFTTKGERGSGLGLWIVEGIINKYGGKITVKSKTGAHDAGSCFILQLPRNPPEAQNQS